MTKLLSPSIQLRACQLSDGQTVIPIAAAAKLGLGPSTFRTGAVYTESPRMILDGLPADRSVQVRALHLLKHDNVMRFYMW